MITLTLLLPGKAVPVQNWTFESETLVRIGRAADNNVVLYSAVVSRHHLEIRRVQSGWEAVNVGANGTYVNGQAITKVPVIDGMIVRLASSGPKIQINIEPEDSPAKRHLAKMQKAQLPPTQDPPHDASKETLIN
ncbi:MAG: FHA domain-containing protein [Snowella sp.]|nr:FHA domain-containing protein [Snowella sp.]